MVLWLGMALQLSSVSHTKPLNQCRQSFKPRQLKPSQVASGEPGRQAVDPEACQRMCESACGSNVELGNPNF